MLSDYVLSWFVNNIRNSVQDRGMRLISILRYNDLSIWRFSGKVTFLILSFVLLGF